MASPQVKFWVGWNAVLAITAIALIGAALIGEHVAGGWGRVAGVTVVAAPIFALSVIVHRRASK
jgi:uncharacterized membrane protein YhaH (DUF805 family)